MSRGADGGPGNSFVSCILLKLFGEIGVMSEAEDNTQGEKQKKQKKKLGVFVRILKWLGLGVLIFLLIVGLFFQAPLKVNGLLLILILACTALPKKALKWFWISVAAVVIALVIWVFLPEKTQGWRPYTFDEELTALEANRVIPDEENAATIYNQLLEEYDSNSFDREFLVGEFYKPTMFSNWSNKDYPEIAKWAEGHKDTIRRLLDVCRFEKCLFPISFYPDNWEGRRERLLPMNDWAKLLIRTGNNDIAENRIDEGLRKYLCVLQMSKHEFQQPTTMDLFVGFNYEAYAIDRLNEFILTGDTTEERLALIKEGVAEIKHDWEHDWHLVIEDEKLWAKNFVSLFYEVNSKGWVRLTWRPEADLLQDLHMHLVPDRRDPGKFRKTWYIIGWFVMPLTPRGAYKIIDSNYKKYYEMFEADFDWIKSEPVFWLQSCKYEFLYVTLNKLMLQMKKTTAVC